MSIVEPPAGFPPGGLSPVMPQGHQVRVAIIWRDVDTAVPLVAPLYTEYVTDRIIGPMSFTRGRPVDAVSIGNLVVGECHFTLLNQDGMFAPYNTASPLYVPAIKRSSVGVGRMISIDFRFPSYAGHFEWSRMWTGIVTSIHPRKDAPGQPPVVDIVGAGPLWFFGDTELEFDEEDTYRVRGLVRKIVETPAFKPSKPLAQLSLSLASGDAHITGWKASGTGLALLGDLELRQAGQELRETKDGYIQIPSDDLPVLWEMMFNDTSGMDTTVDPHVPFDTAYGNPGGNVRPIFQVRSVEEVNAEPLIFNCFSFSVAPADSAAPYPADVAAGGVLLPKLTFTPTADNGITWNAVRKGGYEFPLEGDFKSVVFQPGKTRFKVVWATDFASIDLSTAVWMQADSPFGGSQPEPWNAFRWRSNPRYAGSLWPPVVLDPKKPNRKVNWRLRRTARARTLTAWLLEINFYGIRNYKADQDTNIEYCEELDSVIKVYGRREFPKAPHFANDAEATRWVSIISARYANEALRLTCTITPKDEPEMLNLSSLDLGERVLLRLGEESGLWLDQFPEMIIKRVDWEMDENHVWQAHFDLIDRRFYDKTVVGEVEGGTT